jgi:hypothetical protein
MTQVDQQEAGDATAQSAPKGGRRARIARGRLDERPIRMPQEAWPDDVHFAPWFCRSMRRAWSIQPDVLARAAGVSVNKLQEWERREWKPLYELEFRLRVSGALATLVLPKARAFAYLLAART